MRTALTLSVRPCRHSKTDHGARACISSPSARISVTSKGGGWAPERTLTCATVAPPGLMLSFFINQIGASVGGLGSYCHGSWALSRDHGRPLPSRSAPAPRDSELCLPLQLPLAINTSAPPPLHRLMLFFFIDPIGAPAGCWGARAFFRGVILDRGPPLPFTLTTVAGSTGPPLPL